YFVVATWKALDRVAIVLQHVLMGKLSRSRQHRLRLELQPQDLRCPLVEGPVLDRILLVAHKLNDGRRAQQVILPNGRKFRDGTHCPDEISSSVPVTVFKPEGEAAMVSAAAIDLAV